MLVCLGKLALALEGTDGSRELAHGVEVGREGIEERDNMLREVRARGPVSTEGRGKRDGVSEL